MESNWPKAIKYTAIILMVITLAMVLSLTISSLLPIALVTFGCFVFLAYSTAQNALIEWRFKQLNVNLKFNEKEL